ncbi:MAG: toprim domain-containing protein [Eubacterium sp.]|nr:toprim domain-containing protein [Eubacterium sp.]
MQTKKYIPFSEQDRLMVSKVDLVSFLQLKGEKLERVGKEHKLIYTDATGKHDSITVSGNHWYDHKNQVGGGPIKFLREHYGMSYQEAMLELLGGERATALEIVSAKSNAPSKQEFKLPEANDNMRRVFAYLTKQRFIADDVISFFAHQHKIYEDKEHHNAVFVGTDENCVPKQASLRSTISYGNAFRITVSGSDTKYSFSHFGESGKLFVFEAPIDMLSFITLYQKDWQQHSYIAMNGVYENAVLKALESHSDLKSVYLCTDNDEGGIEAAERLRDILKEKGYTDIFRIAPQQKDWNECLKQLYGADFLPAVPHKRQELYLQSVADLAEMKINPNRIAADLKIIYNSADYRRLAEFSVAASKHFLKISSENFPLDKMKNRLAKEYKCYLDKGGVSWKADRLRSAVNEGLNRLKSYSQTTAELKITARKLYDIADCALRLKTEESLTQHIAQKETSEESLSYESFQMLMN